MDVGYGMQGNMSCNLPKFRKISFLICYFIDSCYFVLRIMFLFIRSNGLKNRTKY